MRCTSPKTVGFCPDGKTLSWSPKSYSKEFATFQLPCGKCISCRLESARQTAIRCVHEASMYPKNCFITLTYDNENILNSRLNYRDFQLFVKRLREDIRNSALSESEKKIGVFVAGEYGDKTKRPHWHAIIFNWEPSDKKPKYKNDRGDQVYSSELLTNLWGKGITELGSVTFESAGYCARYAAKKLTHGKDGEHDFNPISKRSSKHAIGKKWIEKYWKDVFSHGYIVLRNGKTCGIPRYYEKWFQKHMPDHWAYYVTEVKSKNISKAIEQEKRNQEFYQFTGEKQKTDAKIIKQKFEEILQKNLKL